MGDRVLLGMSGGVDSAAAAVLLRQAGCEPVGCTLRLVSSADIGREGSCCSLEDVEDARAVAARLGIDFFVFNFKDLFRRQVMDHFGCGVSGRPDPQPLRPVQPVCEICGASPPGRRPGHSLHRHRPLRPGGLGSGCRPVAAPAGGGPAEGPELLPLPPDPGCAGATAPAGGRLHQGPDPGSGGGRGAGQRPQAGQPGYLLCPRWGLHGVFDPLRRGGAPAGGFCGRVGPGAGPPPGAGAVYRRPATGAGGQR